MQRKRQWVIVILYNVSIEEIIDEIDTEFRAYLKNNTYITWGEPHFWDKLRKSLKKHKRTTWYVEKDDPDTVIAN